MTGHEDERGQGAGQGFNVNLPMPRASSEAVFFDKLDAALDAIHRYQPDAVILTLGFDIHEKDAQAKVAVTREGFHRIGAAAAGVAANAGGSGGGYYLEGLEENTRQFFSGLEEHP